MKIRNVLIFPAGTEVGLEINSALRCIKEVRIYGAGLPEGTHGPFAFDNYYPVPSVYQDGWLDSLVKICRELEIDYIFPAYDDVIVALVQRQDEIPAVVLSATVDVCLLTRSKRATYQALKDVIRVPQVFLPGVDDWASLVYPVFMKPDRGQGSQGAILIKNQQELVQKLAETHDSVICEYLPGEEYTVDCFSDRANGLLFCGARIRLRVRNGIAVGTKIVDLPEARCMAEKIQQSLQMRGAWFFQLKRSVDGELTLLEVAPRVAGSMSVNRVIGVNFPLLTIFEHERLPIEILANKGEVRLDRALCNRYCVDMSFSTMYVDLDDTLIFHDQVNTEVVSLIYSCLNHGRKVKLLTRHAGNLSDTLQKFRLTGLFDEVIHVGVGANKADYIVESDAIFLDDSFSERLGVAKQLGIATFDCSMIEVLADSF